MTESTIDKNGKVLILLLIIFLVFFGYAVCLFRLQVVNGEMYRKEADAVKSQTQTIPAPRGEIFDRTASLPMVINADSFAVDLTPSEIPDGYYDTVTARLSSILEISKRELDFRMPKGENKKGEKVILKSWTKPVEIKVNVPFEKISTIAENITDVPGVSWRSKPIRNYVVTGSISHVVGYVGNITNDEYNVLYNEGYKLNDIVGKMGIEKQYDKLLKGQKGMISRTVDARGKVISDKPIVTDPKMGNSLVLTIDSRIQQLAEKALGKRVGAAVVLSPSNGEILAMVSYPYYDQNIFNSDYASDEYAKLINDEMKPMLNRVVNGTYPPASTFKTIMTTALLSEKVISPYEKIECTGKLHYGNRDFRCHQRWGHGYLDLKNALAQSCDVYYYVTGVEKLGADKIASYATEFGFGQSLEVDLPSQAVGLVPTPQWKDKRYHEPWLGGDTVNMSIGQGYWSVTPMHVANMIAMVANAGVIYKPHLLKEIRDSASGEVIERIDREVLRSSSIDNSVWREVQNDLRYMITNGTATYPMENKVVKMAGKTGTAEVNNLKKEQPWHSWMVAYGPFDAPVEQQVVVCVLVEAINEWEWWAPYATNIIFQGIFANQSYEDAVNSLPNVRAHLREIENKNYKGRQE
ncbi:MAG: penicillin-binding protein 2 [Treponema sp.]|nr:penicillin-binding protein 2 [Treponema sp.]